MKEDLQAYWQDLELWLENLGFGLSDIEVQPKTKERFVAVYNKETGEKEEAFVLPKEFQDIPLPQEGWDEDLTDSFGEN